MPNGPKARPFEYQTNGCHHVFLCTCPNVSGIQMVGIQIPTVNAQRISDFENANFVKIRLQKQGRGGAKISRATNSFRTKKKVTQPWWLGGRALAS